MGVDDISFATIGGILLIMGSFFVYRGEIYKSVFVFFLADITWIIISYQSGDYFGSGVVAIGMLLGVAAYLRMNLGSMRKNLHW